MKLSHRKVLTRFLLVCVTAVLATSALLAQDSPVRRGRKYKPPPATTKITVLVTKKSTGKPIMNAAVIFNPYKDGKDIGNLEVKTDPDGKATIDIIPTGSKVTVQVIANGMATFAQDYQVNEPTKDIAIEMQTPREQVSSYRENKDAPSSRKWGVQEPIRPKTTTQKQDSGSTSQDSQPAPKQ
ncbi:MAG TPA: Ig-like domain-containing protein [Edaphobacter sp.]|nr:Ig-like domain-containing protein [Edaphobacter sp.]